MHDTVNHKDTGPLSYNNDTFAHVARIRAAKGRVETAAHALLLALLATLALLVATHEAEADTRGEFCAGFVEGYKTIRGNNVLVPLCPLAPITPLGSTPYKEGLKAGTARAR